MTKQLKEVRYLVKREYVLSDEHQEMYDKMKNPFIRQLIMRNAEIKTITISGENTYVDSYDNEYELLPNGQVIKVVGN